MPSAPRFTKRPKPLIRATEGATVELPCASDGKLESGRWLKLPINAPPDKYLEIFESGQRQSSLFSRFEFIGNKQQSDHSIVIQNAQLGDSGQYVCEMLHEEMDLDQLDQYRVATNLTVLPAAAPPQTVVLASMGPQASSANSNSNSNSNNHNHNHGPATEANDEEPKSEQPQPKQAQMGQPRQLNNGEQRPRSTQVRDISPTWTRLSTSNNFISSSMQQPSTNHLGPAAGTMVASWPFMLLGLAGILMLVNIYLIYKLIKRYNGRGSDSSCSA